MKEQLDMDIADLKINLINTEKALYYMNDNRGDGGKDKIVKILESRMKYLESSLILLEKSKEERIFETSNYKVKVWRSGSRVGIEKIWIREGWRYWTTTDTVPRLVIDGAEYGYHTVINTHIVSFGNHYCVGTAFYEIEESEINYTYSDIVAALESMETNSDEVSVYDVIDECHKILDAETAKSILENYEIQFGGRPYWNMLINHVDSLSNPIRFVVSGHKLRLKK